MDIHANCREDIADRDATIADLTARLAVAHHAAAGEDARARAAEAKLSAAEKALADLTAKLREAEKCAAPMNAKALSHIKNPCTKHNPYWTTNYGACMACRAVDAEAKLSAAEKALADEREAGRVMGEALRLH